MTYIKEAVWLTDRITGKSAYVNGWDVLRCMVDRLETGPTQRDGVWMKGPPPWKNPYRNHVIPVLYKKCRTPMT